jgi:hypothetical protein
VCAQFVLRPTHDFWHGAHQSAGGALHGPAALCHRSRWSAGETHFVSALLLSPLRQERERPICRARTLRPSIVRPRRPVFLSTLEQSALTQKPFLSDDKTRPPLVLRLSGRAIVMFRRRLCPPNSSSAHSL